MFFLQSYVIMMSGCLQERENKRICQMSGLKSGRDCVRKYRSGPLQESFQNNTLTEQLFTSGGLWEVVAYKKWSP